MFLYRFFKLILRFAIGQFYRLIHVKGRENLVEDGAVIVVANHPNGMLDPVLVASVYTRDFFFLAKSGLFRPRILGWFMRRLRILPVYRPTDGHDAKKNLGMFDAVAKKLGEGEAIMLFPEGTSEGERKLLEIKTGFARIAFLAESLLDWDLDLKIQPIGTSYSDFGAFRGTVTIAVGEPIRVFDWKEMYERSPREAIADIARVVRERLEALTVNVNDIEHEQLVNKIEKVYNLTDPDVHLRLREIATAVEAAAPNHPELRSKVEERLDDYLGNATAMRLIPGQETVPSSWWLICLLLSPLVVLGGLIHWLPVFATRKIANLPHHKSYTATRKLLFGSLLMVIWYAILGVGAMLSGCGLLVTCGLLTGSAALGVLANRYLPWVRRLAYALPFSWRSGRLTRLKRKRAALIELLESTRESKVEG